MPALTARNLITFLATLLVCLASAAAAKSSTAQVTTAVGFSWTPRNRSRRWCQMETCGNKAKAKAYYHRHGTGG